MRKTLYSIMLIDEPYDPKRPLLDEGRVNLKEDEEYDNFGTFYSSYDFKKSGYVVTFMSDSFNLKNELIKLKKENKELLKLIKNLDKKLKTADNLLLQERDAANSYKEMMDKVKKIANGEDYEDI